MILLDTHAWLWWLQDPSQLSPTALKLIQTEEPHNGLLVSSISVWEIAVKVSIGKLQLPLPMDEWYEQAQQHPGIVIEPLEPLDAIPTEACEAISSTQLPGDFHKDPADRILVAIARRRNIPLITRDQKILAYPNVQSIW